MMMTMSTTTTTMVRMMMIRRRRTRRRKRKKRRRRHWNKRKVNCTLYDFHLLTELVSLLYNRILQSNSHLADEMTSECLLELSILVKCAATLFSNMSMVSTSCRYCRIKQDDKSVTITNLLHNEDP